MRNIFSDKEQTNNLFNQEKNMATKQDIQDLSNQISAISASLDSVSENLSQYITSMGKNITTGQINALQAAISILEATNAKLTSANITSLTVSGMSSLATLTANLATIASDLNVGGNVDINGNIKASNATFEEITATTANIANWTVENLTANKITATEIDVDSIKSNGTVSANNIESTTATIGNLSGNEITANKVTVSNELSSGLGTFDEVKVENIHWKESVDYPNTTEVYLTVPHFENGTYYLRANGPTKTLFTVEILNSVDNFFVRWSQALVGYISTMYKIGNDSNAQICIHIKNIENVAFTLEYATVCATPNVSAPVGSVNPPSAYGTRYPVIYKDGNKFFRLVDLANQGSDHHILSKVSTNVYDDATFTYTFDGTENVIYYDYIPDQSLNKNDNVQFNKIVTSESSATSSDISKDLTVGEKVKLPNIYNGPALTEEEKAALPDDTLLIDTNVISRKTTKAGTVQIKPFVPYDENNVSENRPLVYDQVNDVLKKATGDIDIPGNLTVGGNTKLTGDTFISGDLTVSGTVHSIDQEEIVADGDTVTLRANNNLPLATGQVSGIVVNKYNGTDNLTVATGNDGTLRVGTAEGTDTTYTNIALNHSDGKYYTYENNTYTLLDPQPNGNMTSWTGKDVVGGYTHYATAVFTVIDTTTLSPIATRDEEENMNDGGVVVWDSNTTSMKTVPLPTNNAQTLVSKWTEDPNTHVITKGYEWKSNVGVGEHNSIFRGKCLNGNPATMYPILPIGNTKNLPGGGYTIEQVLANISAGNFDDIYIGDYFIDSNNKVYRIAGLDTELNKGNTPLTSHHAVIVTDFALTNMGWNHENTTVGGYQSSDVQAYCDGDGQAAIESVFGAAHVLTVSDVLSKAINATATSPGYPGWQGVTSDWGWFSHKVRLMSEVEVYGARVWSGSFDIGTANEQFPLFRLMPQLATGLRYSYWLSGIVNATIACCVPDFGSARYYATGGDLGVRVRFLVG